MWTDGQAGHSRRFHSGAWLLWLGAAMLAALLTRNPLYLALIMAASALAVRVPSRAAGGQGLAFSDISYSGGEKRGRSGLLRVVVGITLVVALLKGMSIHIGTTVLFRLPEALPVIGGPVTLEGIASSGLDALSLLAMLAVFAAFSTGADYYAILRAVPPFLHQMGLVVSIAITFVPQTVVRFAEIREAQALRGHRVRRVSDLLPLIMPLLAGGMERSVDLAEAMEARGFSTSRGESAPSPVRAQAGIAAGLALILTGSALVPFVGLIAWAAIGAGSMLLGWTLWRMGRGSGRTRLRRAVWTEGDTALAAVSIGLSAFLLSYRFLAPAALLYYPFPRIHLPAFDPAVALALLGLAAPLILKRTGMHAAKQASPEGARREYAPPPEAR